MTYGFCPQNWRAFEAELQEQGIAIADIEKVEMRPEGESDRMVSVTITLRGDSAVEIS